MCNTKLKADYRRKKSRIIGAISHIHTSQIFFVRQKSYLKVSQVYQIFILMFYIVIVRSRPPPTLGIQSYRYPYIVTEQYRIETRSAVGFTFTYDLSLNLGNES